MKKSLIAATLFATALLAGPDATTQQTIDEVTAVGQKASAELLKTLGGNLKKHLEAGGAMDAFAFCSTNAYALTQKVDESFGKDVSVKRVSIKYRNPANKPQEDEAAVLHALHLMNQNGVVLPEGFVENAGNGVYKYYKPLVIDKKACLVCHGDVNKDKKLAAAIREIYPSDRATGYKMNDLRGAVVVTVKK